MSSEKIHIFDTTLRDGEQSPGCSMTLDEKLVLARQIEKLGVDIIEAGFPAASDGDFESVHMVAKEIRKPAIAGLCRTRPGDLERAAKALEVAARPRIHTFIATSDIHMEHKLRMSRERVLEEVDRAVRQAKGYVDDVEFSAEDATRSDRDFLVEVFQAAVNAGASTLNVPDTVGYTTPAEYGRLISYLREQVEGSDKVIFSVHCHNDLGLAVANSLSAVAAGARQVECTVNGIGERAGNAAVEEVAMAIQTRPEAFGDVYTDIHTEEIYPSSRLLSTVVGVPVQPNKAIVGENAFAHEAGIHQDGVLKKAITYEIMTPQSIGRPSNALVLGKHSGRHAFVDRLKEMGFDLDGDKLEQAFTRFKTLADKKKVIYNADLEAIVSDEILRAEERYKLGNLVIISGSFATPTATVELIDAGVAKKTSAMGDGPVDAVFKAIKELTGTESKLLTYEVKAVTEGMDAQGDVSVKLVEGERSVIGQGAHTDIIVASGKAYVRALNKLEWHKQQHSTNEPKGI